MKYIAHFNAGKYFCRTILHQIFDIKLLNFSLQVPIKKNCNYCFQIMLLFLNIFKSYVSSWEQLLFKKDLTYKQKQYGSYLTTCWTSNHNNIDMKIGTITKNLFYREMHFFLLRMTLQWVTYHLLQLFASKTHHALYIHSTSTSCYQFIFMITLVLMHKIERNCLCWLIWDTFVKVYTSDQKVYLVIICIK